MNYKEEDLNGYIKEKWEMLSNCINSNWTTNIIQEYEGTRNR